MTSHSRNLRVLTQQEIAELTSDTPEASILLSRIVMLVGNHFATDVCSIYLFERQAKEIVLAATVGLHQQCIGQVRMSLDQGLAGMVARTCSPVAVENASEHPHFAHFPETGEDAFHSFLGVPLLDQGMLCGVLVVQTVEARVFSPEEIAMLAGMANAVAPLIHSLASAET